MKIKEKIINVATGEETIVYYSQVELDQIQAKEAADNSFYIDYAKHIQYKKDLRDVYKARIVAYGSPTDQLDYMYDFGFNGYVQRQLDIKTMHAKPVLTAYGLVQLDIDTFDALIKPEGYIDPLSEI